MERQMGLFLRKPRLFGHRNGVKNVRSVVNAAREIGVQYITLLHLVLRIKTDQEKKIWTHASTEEFLKRELANMVKDVAYD